MKNEQSRYSPFSNNFGSLDNDDIIIQCHKRKLRINTRLIRKIHFVKRRNLFTNAFLLFLSSLIFWTMEYNTIFAIDKVILGASGIALLLPGLFYRNFESEMVIVLQFDFIKIKVKNSLEEDAKKLITQFINQYSK